jgi:hypothetical protein
MYTNIPPGFPIKYPYPLPSPAPPPPREVPYARAIPPQVNERIAARLRDQTRVKTPEKECLARSPVPPDKGKGRANEVDSAPATEVSICAMSEHWLENLTDLSGFVIVEHLHAICPPSSLEFNARGEPAAGRRCRSLFENGSI